MAIHENCRQIMDLKLQAGICGMCTILETCSFGRKCIKDVKDLKLREYHKKEEEEMRQ